MRGATAADANHTTWQVPRCVGSAKRALRATVWHNSYTSSAAQNACATLRRLCRRACAAFGSSSRRIHQRASRRSRETTSSCGANSLAAASKRCVASEESVDSGGSLLIRDPGLEARKGPERQAQHRQLQRASVQRVLPRRSCAQCHCHGTPALALGLRALVRRCSLPGACPWLR